MEQKLEENTFISLVGLKLRKCLFVGETLASIHFSKKFCFKSSAPPQNQPNANLRVPVISIAKRNQISKMFHYVHCKILAFKLINILFKNSFSTLPKTRKLHFRRLHLNEKFSRFLVLHRINCKGKLPTCLIILKSFGIVQPIQGYGEWIEIENDSKEYIVKNVVIVKEFQKFKSTGFIDQIKNLK